MSVWQNLPEEVGCYLLPLPAYSPVWFGLVKCLQTALRFIFLLFFDSIFFSWPAWMDFTTPLSPCISTALSLSLFLSLCAFPAPAPPPPCPLPPTCWRASWHSPGVLATASRLCDRVIVWVTDWEYLPQRWKQVWKGARGLIMRSKRSSECFHQEGIMSCMC